MARLILTFFVVAQLVCSVARGASAQEQTVSIADRIGGSWYGRVETAERAPRYLEVLGVEADGRGGYTARTVFGWGDGSVSIVAADVVATAQAVNLSLTAQTGARLQVAFADRSAATGSYHTSGRAARPIRLERLREAPNHGVLIGVWSAKRAGETRIFDIKRVLAASDGTVLAVGQLGFAEKPDEMRQLVAAVSGEPANVQVRWTTASTAVDLRRTKPNELTGVFRRLDTGSDKPDRIVFRQETAKASKVATGSEPGQRFPDFTMTSIDGKVMKLSDFRGKPVVVNFFQPWCIWCIEEFAVWRAAIPRYGDKLAILPVVYGTTSPEWMQQSARAKRYGVPIYGVDAAPVSFKGIPHSWVIDKDGIIVEKMRYQRAHDMFAKLDSATK